MFPGEFEPGGQFRAHLVDRFRILAECGVVLLHDRVDLGVAFLNVLHQVGVLLLQRFGEVPEHSREHRDRQISKLILVLTSFAFGYLTLGLLLLINS